MNKESKNRFDYETEVEWRGERQGVLRSITFSDIDVAARPEFKGHKGKWTPEHLFIASVNSCFMTTFLAIAENSKLEIVSFRSKAKGVMEKKEGSSFQISEILLRPIVVIQTAGDIARAERILDKAESQCPISKSVKTKIRLEPQVFHQQSPVYPCATVSK